MLAVRTVTTVRLVVLNYNRRDLLERFLPSIVAAARESRYKCTVTVLDNASTDGSAEFVKKNYPDTALYIAPENRVLCSYNNYVRGLTEDVVVLLNNDMELEGGFVDPLVAFFEKDPETFFVATHGDKAAVDWRWGVLSVSIDYPGYEKAIEEPGASLSAGVAAFDRKKFLDLGGYDTLYLPGRYEDVDLCYRGWKRGWRGYYTPLSRKKHLGGASFEKAFDSATTQAMVCRNGILFMVKNITDPFLFARFLFLQPLRALAAALQGKWFLLKGIADSFGRLPQALGARKECARTAMLSDRAALRKVKDLFHG